MSETAYLILRSIPGRAAKAATPGVGPTGPPTYVPAIAAVPPASAPEPGTATSRRPVGHMDGCGCPVCGALAEPESVVMQNFVTAPHGGENTEGEGDEPMGKGKKGKLAKARALLEYAQGREVDRLAKDVEMGRITDPGLRMKATEAVARARLEALNRARFAKAGVPVESIPGQSGVLDETEAQKLVRAVAERVRQDQAKATAPGIPQPGGRQQLEAARDGHAQALRPGDGTILSTQNYAAREQQLVKAVETAGSVDARARAAEALTLHRLKALNELRGPIGGRR